MVGICRYSLRRWHSPRAQQSQIRSSHEDELPRRDIPLSPRELVEAFVQQLWDEGRALAEFNQQAEKSDARRCA